MTDRQRSLVSRRATMKIGAASLGVLAGGYTQRGLAQDGVIPEVVRTFLDAWIALDPAAIAATYAADGRREDITTPTVFSGHDEIRQSLADFLGAFAGVTVEHPDVLSGPGPMAADTWVFTGDYVGQLPGFPAGSGQPLTIRGFTLIDIVDDEIARTVDYYDAASILAQIDGAPAATPIGD